MSSIDNTWKSVGIREDLRPLVEMLKQAIANEEARIERAQAEIFKLRLQLAEFGVELPLDSTY